MNPWKHTEYAGTGFPEKDGKAAVRLYCAISHGVANRMLQVIAICDCFGGESVTGALSPSD